VQRKAAVVPALSIQSTYFDSLAVDNGASRSLYRASGRAAALARWRVREAPHCLYGESSGQPRGHVGCAGFGGSGVTGDGVVRLRDVWQV